MFFSENLRCNDDPLDRKQIHKDTDRYMQMLIAVFFLICITRTDTKEA